MEAVFNRPMVADSFGKTLSREKLAQDVVAILDAFLTIADRIVDGQADRS